MPGFRGKTRTSACQTLLTPPASPASITNGHHGIRLSRCQFVRVQMHRSQGTGETEWTYSNVSTAAPPYPTAGRPPAGPPTNPSSQIHHVDLPGMHHGLLASRWWRGSGWLPRGRISSGALRPSFKVHRSRWIARASRDHGRPPHVCSSRLAASPSRRPGVRSFQHQEAPRSDANKVLPTHLDNTRQLDPRWRWRAKRIPPRRAAPGSGQRATNGARPAGLVRLPTRAKVVHNRRTGCGQTRARVADRRSADWTAKALGEATEPHTERPPEPR